MDYPKIMIIQSLTNDFFPIEPIIQLAPYWLKQKKILKLFEFKITNNKEEINKIKNKMKRKRNHIIFLLKIENEKKYLKYFDELNILIEELNNKPIRTYLQDKNNNLIKNVNDLVCSIYENFNDKYDLKIDDSKFYFIKKNTLI